MAAIVLLPGSDAVADAPPMAPAADHADIKLEVPSIPTSMPEPVITAESIDGNKDIALATSLKEASVRAAQWFFDVIDDNRDGTITIGEIKKWNTYTLLY